MAWHKEKVLKRVREYLKARVFLYTGYDDLRREFGVPQQTFYCWGFNLRDAKREARWDLAEEYALQGKTLHWIARKLKMDPMNLWHRYKKSRGRTLRQYRLNKYSKLTK